ncbi:type II toxin-antitoxin system death-on-curing family toxin [Larkinella insperata]|uniref:Type II toxin-antitoxin system death-on-curing family toxin n=1 Tax=Larkinella insperata TaxID=332158 RepID=A0ABW3Q5U1_9BACT|nr:type II toxin-antitoxin system death-on-curing family toxin [Larkinella insperata]
MNYPDVEDIISLHKLIIQQSGGSAGIRDQGGLGAAVAQPRMTFASKDLYPTIGEKASAICFSLVLNHPFVDGNKRIGQAAMEFFLLLNGYEVEADVDEQERIILDLAAGLLDRDAFTQWLNKRIVSLNY